MNLFANIVNAARAARTAWAANATPKQDAAPKTGKPKSGRVVIPSERGFEIADLFTAELSPANVSPVLRDAVNGDPERMFAIYDRMLESDGHLRSVYDTRKKALGGLAWELVPASEVGRHPKINEEKAKAAHEHCAEMLADIDNFDAALRWLHDAIGRGIKIAELEWRNQKPVAAHCIEDCLLRGDMMNPRRIRIATETDWKGIAVDEFPPGKFIVHAPESIGGLPIRGGLHRTAVLLFLAKRMGIQSWIIFNELYGQPIAVGKYGSEADTAVRRELTSVLRELGANRGGMFPAGTEIELLEAAAKGILPQQAFAKYVDSEFSKHYLGQTLTTELGDVGSQAAATVHNDVRDDRRDDDVRAEGETIRSQLILPICRIQFGEDAALHAPYFRRVVEEARDLLDECELLDRVVNRLGAKVPKSVISDDLGIRLVEGEKPEDPLPGATGADPFGNDLAFNRAIVGRKDGGKGIVRAANRTLADIAKRRRTAVSKTASWIIAAVAAFGIHAGNVTASMQAFIDKKRTLETALADLPELFDQLPIEDAVHLENELFAAAKMAGIEHAQRQLARLLFARNKIESGKQEGRKGSPKLVRALNAADIDFARIPFVKAIEALRDRIGLTPEEFELLDAEARSRAWRVAGVANMEMLAVMHQALVKSIAEGETSRDFRLRVPQMVEAAGWSGENPWHADLVHYQNFVMAHSAGRYAEYKEFGAAGWRFVANGETCPLCEPFVNKVFSLDDRKAFPPVHFWCDCEDEVIFEDEVEGVTLDQSATIKSAALDAVRAKPSAFNWDPASYANLVPLKLGGFPDALRPVFESFARERGWEVAA